LVQDVENKLWYTGTILSKATDRSYIIAKDDGSIVRRNTSLIRPTSIEGKILKRRELLVDVEEEEQATSNATTEEETTRNTTREEETGTGATTEETSTTNATIKGDYKKNTTDLEPKLRKSTRIIKPIKKLDL